MADMSHWQMFLFLAGLVAAWSIVMLGVQKAMMSSGFKELTGRVEELKKSSERIQGVERQILELKAELPVQYVRREDHLRDSATLYIKIDRMSEKFESKFDELRHEIMNMNNRSKEGGNGD